MLIAIDPGAAGGIALVDSEGKVTAENMPEGMTQLCNRLRQLSMMGFTRAAVERTGGYMPGNSGPAAAKFAAHCAHIEAGLYLCGISMIYNPVPRTWQKKIGVPVFAKNAPPAGCTDSEAKSYDRAEFTRCKALRKVWIREWAQRRFPHLRVTMSTADALAILHVAMMEERA